MPGRKYAATAPLWTVPRPRFGNKPMPATTMALCALILMISLSLGAQTNCTPPPPGLVSWWRAESNAFDWIGGNNGTIQGDVRYVRGEVGDAFEFNGNESGILLGSPTNLELQNLTIEGWIQRATNTLTTFDSEVPLGAYLFGYFQDDEGYGFGIDNEGILFFATGGNVFGCSGKVSDTSFHHVAVTVSATNLLFYIDGAGYSGQPYDPDCWLW
jgi:hypothetical protein